MRPVLVAVGLFILATMVPEAQVPANGSGTIWVTVNVIHQDGHLIADLGASDFEIEDNGQAREIAMFRNDSIPVALALMVDISGSMESNYGLIRRAVLSLTSQFEPGDRAIIGSFNALPWIGDRFSARPEALLQSLTGIFSGGLSLCDGDWIDKTTIARRSESSAYGRTSEFSRRLRVHGGSAIWDGAACGVNAVASDGETPRRVVVLMTDGMDTMSSSTVTNVVERADRLGVMVYAISVMGGYGMAGADLRGLAEATGGGYFFLTDDDKVSEAFVRIGDELRRQYVLGFTSNGPVKGPHKIVVRSRAPNTTTRFRRVHMQLPGGQPLSAPAQVRLEPGSVASLPPTLLPPISTATRTSRPVVIPDSSRERTPLWDSLDQFIDLQWRSGTAPRMSLDQLRSMLAMLRRDARHWINAVQPASRPTRRLAAAAFVLDLLYTQNDPYVWLDGKPAVDLLEWATKMLQEESPTPGERLWCLGAIALLERASAHAALDGFALDVLRRFPDEPRFVLARGVAQELRTWPEERDVQTFTVAPDLASLLVARYETASELPAVKLEATLRLAYFELRRGRIDAALARFSGIGDEQPDDVILRFWLHLLRGRAFEEAGRFSEAIGMFEEALADVPGAPSARSALIASLTKARRHSDAARIAAMALTTPPADIDPWTIYILPDMRYWSAINEQLRELVTR